MDNTIVQQGSFTSAGVSVTLVLRSDIDWLMVYNATVAAANQGAAVGFKNYWQRGFPAAAKWVTYKTNAANAANLEQYDVTGGFTLIDTSLQTTGRLNGSAGNAAITAISNAAIPVVSNANINGLVAGDVVRILNTTGAQQLGGMDFTVGHNILTDGTFSLDYMATIVAGTVGSWRHISFNPIFYPRRRFITKITAAAQAVVTMSVTHGYSIGQSVRFHVPPGYGMVEMHGLLGTIVSINTTLTTGNKITVDIDSTAFTAFAFPLTADVPFTPAEVVPVGMDTAEAIAEGVDILSDATVNRAFMGIRLAGGVDNPAGEDDDVLYWVAGKSFSIANAGENVV